MNYPSIYISNASDKLKLSDSFITHLDSELFIAYHKQLESKLVIFDRQNFLLIAHVNLACKVKLNEYINNLDKLYNNPSLIASDFNWGFILLIKKVDKQILFFNDIFGIYPLFYVQKDSGFIVSNDFDGLVNLLDSVSIDVQGIYDYLLFNYTLKSRTLLQNVLQLQGSSLISYSNKVFKVIRYFNIVEYISSNSKKQMGEVEMSKSLKQFIKSNIDPDLPVCLPLTGGFDSKLILSVLLSENIKFTSFTFGDKKSADNITANAIADDFKFKHNFIGFSSGFNKEFEEYIDKYLRCSPNASMFDTLINYQLVKEHIPACNMITGKMGGELIVGPVLISELITTRSSALLTLCSNEDELVEGLSNQIKDIGYLNYEIFLNNATKYIKPIKDYMQTPVIDKNFNIVSFLLNETYAKFFGAVFNNLFSKYNIINPLVNIDFLKLLINSKYSFTRKKPFSSAPISHFISRKLYPKLIKVIYPPVLKTQMDRGYKLEDFIQWYSFFRPFLNYFKRHFYHKQTKPPEAYIRYMGALKELTLKNVSTSRLIDWEIINKDNLLTLLKKFETNKTTKFQEQKLIQLLTIDYFIRRYADKLI